MAKTKRLLLKLLALPLLVLGCGEAGGDDGRYDVVATVGMVGDVVENVAGGRADVRTLMGPGVDPHLFKPGRDDVVALAAADLVFYNGLLLEGKMGDVLGKMAQDKPVVAVTEEIDDGYLIELPQYEGNPDPHVWMDPDAWVETVDVVAEALVEYDPPNADEYRANAEAYKAEVAALGEYGREALSSVPEGRRVLVTSHDAFNYFGRAFGLEVLGVQGLSTESEAGLRRMAELVDLLVDRDVTAVFVESSVPRKSIEALIEGAEARGHEVAVGGTLYSDAMGSMGTYEGTYVGMIDHNVTTVARALGGDAPERGMNGKLSQ